MDSLRGFDDEYAIVDHDDSDHSGVETPLAIGADERRMHVRAYNHWASLLRGRAFPSIEDLNPEAIEDFGPNSVLLDFTASVDKPLVAYIGGRLSQECAPDAIDSVADVPNRSLLSRLTDHYLQIIANRAPIGFEAEFVNQAGVNMLYRGILMPYSSDGETIDFMHGVINWKERADPALEAELVLEVEQAIQDAPGDAEPVPIWADGPAAGAFPDLADDVDEPLDLAEPILPEDAGLADMLDAARQGADAVRVADGRSRAALYRALSLAYDFACLAEARPEEYAELLDDAGLKVQDRAPMTPIVKLVFGADYDKTRLTEFAAALAHGRRRGLAVGGLRNFLEAYPGGLKGVVKAERDARAPAPRPPRIVAAANQLRQMAPQAIIEMESGDGEFVVLVARRVSKTGLAVLSPVLDQALVDRAVLKATE